MPGTPIKAADTRTDVGSAPGGFDLTAEVAKKVARIAKLKDRLAVAQSQSSAMVPSLTATIATQKNRIENLKGKLSQAETQGSGNKTAAILAERSALAAQLNEGGLVPSGGGGVMLVGLALAGLWFATKKGWLKI